jgi:hypothetical protein
MKRLGIFLTSWIEKLGLPFLLFVLAVLSFGIFIPFLGFYSDDWTFVWLAHRLGPASTMLHYVSNRPFLGFLTIPILAVLGDIPWHYQVFALLSRFCSALVLVWLIRLVWPQQKRLGVFAATIFLLYPGLTAWPVALMTGEHYYLVFSIFLLSLCFSFLAIRQPEHRRLWQPLAWLFSLLNLLFSEYYFFLELTRPFFLWVIFSETIPSNKEKLRRVIIDFGPFLIEFCLILLWRMKYFPNQQGWYQIVFFDELLADPIRTILDLLSRVARDIYSALGPGMIGRFGIPDVLTEGNFVFLLFPIAILAALITLVCVFVFIHKETQLPGSGIRKNLPIVLLGGICLLMAGPAFWVANLSPSLPISHSRFFLPFTLGASLLFAGLLNCFPRRAYPILLLSLFVCIATGSNLRMGNQYRIDWKTQQRLFLNITWRIPSLPAHTLIISNEIPGYSTSNTYLSTVMNWLYDTNPEQGIVEDYFWEFDHNTRILSDMDESAIIRDHFRSLSFSAAVEDVLVLDYANGCLVVLDPEIDEYNPLLSDELRQLAIYSHPQIINTDPAELNRIQFLLGDEINLDWCYYYSQAEVYAQQGNWDAVVQIYDENETAFPMKYSTARFFVVFIEGLAHTGQMERTRGLTDLVIQNNGYSAVMMCHVWQRIEIDDTVLPSSGLSPSDIITELGCSE